MKIQSIIISVIVFTLFLSGCTTNSNEANIVEPNTDTPSFIIDAHVHYRANDDWEESFVEVYEDYNAMGCLLIGMDELERGIKFAEEHPDLVIPYASIDIDSPTVLEDIKKVHSMGFKGLGELFATNEWSYNDSKYEPVWALAEELGLVLLPHTGIHASGNFANMRPSYLASIASNHPDLNIVGAHFGNPWYSETGEAARLNENLYFEMSGSSLIKKNDNPEFWQDILWWTPHIGKRHVGSNLKPAWENVVFASDEGPSGLEANIIRFNKVLDAANVADSTRAQMYGRTLARIHGIEIPDTE